MLASESRQRSRAQNLRLFTAATAVAIGIIGCDPYVNVSGVVREASGAPIADVTVTLQMAGREPYIVTTAGDGSFGVGMVGADSKRTYVSFRKVGFKPVEEVVGEPEQRTMDVTLLRE